MISSIGVVEKQGGSMSTYVFHWKNGTTDTLDGDDAVNALNRAGFGPGALTALDYYEQVQ